MPAPNRIFVQQDKIQAHTELSSFGKKTVLNNIEASREVKTKRFKSCKEQISLIGIQHSLKSCTKPYLVQRIESAVKMIKNYMLVSSE